MNIDDEDDDDNDDDDDDDDDYDDDDDNDDDYDGDDDDVGGGCGGDNDDDDCMASFSFPACIMCSMKVACYDMWPRAAWLYNGAVSLIMLSFQVS